VSTNGGGGGSGFVVDPMTCTQEDPGPTFLRRLSNVEYANTLRDLLGQDLPNLTVDFPLDSLKNGFDNNSEYISISTPVVDAYRVAAERVASTVMTDTTLQARLVGCTPSGTTRASCLKSFIQRFGRAAWRRALSSDEVDALVALSDVAVADANAYQSVALVLRAVLQSPDFLFRVEDSSPTAAPRALTGYELASRLSYGLWQTTPDEALLTAAEGGALSTTDGLRAQTQRLLADPRARVALRRFHQAWLRLDLLDRARVSSTDYPMWTQALRDSLREEALQLTDSFTWRGATGSYLELVTSPSSFVDANLATLYGVPAPAAPWSKVALPKEQRRSGVLTLGAVLALTGRPEGTSAIIRGRYVREVLLCEQLPAPPPNVPAVPAPLPGETERQRLDRHRTDPACSSCHKLLEPVGFGMSQFDQVGRFAPVDSTGATIDTHGTLANYPSPDFDGPVELGNKLAQLPNVSGCVSTELFRYLFGRTECSQDACTVALANQQFKDTGYDFVGLVTAYVTSDSFRFRTSQADTL
jgi:hypothetical protein